MRRNTGHDVHWRERVEQLWLSPIGQAAIDLCGRSAGRLLHRRTAVLLLGGARLCWTAVRGPRMRDRAGRRVRVSGVLQDSVREKAAVRPVGLRCLNDGA